MTPKLCMDCTKDLWTIPPLPLTHQLDINKGFSTLQAAGPEYSPSNFVWCSWEQDGEQQQGNIPFFV